MHKVPVPLPADPQVPFPPVDWALREPDGLLAWGGDLSPARLCNAYAHGVFPWFSEGQPILWWSPDPRAVFATDGVRLSRRFRRQLRQSRWVVRADTAFARVIDACAHAPRPGQHGTWIIAPMRHAYAQLHALGHAHSIEVWAPADDAGGERLVGGLYGVSLGRMFFAESMFSADSGGSKVALAALAHRLAQWGWPWIDAQLPNPHLVSLGVQAWPRTRFLRALAGQLAHAEPAGRWTARFGTLAAADLSDRAGTDEAPAAP